jgi:hypothetical protein
MRWFVRQPGKIQGEKLGNQFSVQLWQLQYTARINDPNAQRATLLRIAAESLNENANHHGNLRYASNLLLQIAGRS